MLTLKNVQKYYEGFHLNCSLTVPTGCITGLIGQNGAGKSTMFKAILNLISIDSGEIRLFNQDIASLSSLDKQKLGVVLSDSGFSGYLTIKNIMKVNQHMYTDFEEEYFLSQCERFHLPLNKMIKEFSTGMKAKLKVLLALSHNAQFLILDEPTSGLDTIARDEILDLLREYMETEGRSILISSHISTDLETLCDEIYMIHNGSIVLHEETDCLFDQYGVLKVSEEQFRTLDKQYLLRTLKEPFGYSCLTNEKAFYVENYPAITIERGNIDNIITTMIRGEK